MYVGGKQANRHRRDRECYGAEDAYGKTPVIGAIQRCGKVVPCRSPHRRHHHDPLRRANVKHGSRVITDDHGGYNDLMESYRHRTVKHSVGEYVKNVDVHTNTIESLWSMFKRRLVGTYRPYELQAPAPRDVNEFAGRKGIREQDTLDQMGGIVRGLEHKRLRFRDLVA